MQLLTILILLSSGLFILFLSPSKAVIALIVAATLVPMGSSIYIGTISFYPVRILAIFLVIRVLIKQEYINFSLIKTDKIILAWAIIMVIIGFIRPDPDASIVFRFGEAYGIICIYFPLRILNKKSATMINIFSAIAVVFCVIAIAMFFEKVNRFNLFSLLGGVPSYPAIRNGKVRCQGPFGSSILAGTAAATSFGFMLALNFINKGNRTLFYLGSASAIAIVYLSASSGPIMSLLILVIALLIWSFRKSVKEIRWMVILTLIMLNFIMESPVWFLMAKIDLTGSSTGWHRAELIDSAIHHIGEWWLLGTSYTRHWMPYGITWSDRHVDITNQYLKNGVWGGLILMLLFIGMITSSYKIIGDELMNNANKNKGKEKLLWILGAMLFTHSMTFLTIRYFDQTIFYYYLLLAMIGSIGERNKNKET